MNIFLDSMWQYRVVYEPVQVGCPYHILHVSEAPSTGLQVVHHELPCVLSNVATTTQMILDDNITLAQDNSFQVVHG
jgi:hypothetical protein